MRPEKSLGFVMDLTMVASLRFTNTILDCEFKIITLF